MRFYIGLLAGAVLTVAGCGTYRQVVDHTKPDSVVQAIIPTSGVSGQSVTFQAQICNQAGTTDPAFLWNFGGGADPNASFEKSPAVTLRAGQAAAYKASLTLTGGCLGSNLSATYPFDLSIAPLTILAVTGNSGISTKSGGLSVVVGTGVATKYVWDFGGAGTSTTSTTQSPTITFGAPGIYNAHVIVANDYEAVQQDFTITVN